MGIDRAEMARRVEEYKSSGQSVTEYCRQRGYHTARFYNWRKLTESSITQIGFARIQTGVKVTVEISDRMKLIDLPIESLRAVLRELE
jgi:transposase-like protein